jgi:hypothetical protein
MGTGNYTCYVSRFKKAFDMITHAMLSDKLKLYKLDNLALRWL